MKQLKHSQADFRRTGHAVLGPDSRGARSYWRLQAGDCIECRVLWSRYVLSATYVLSPRYVAEVFNLLFLFTSCAGQALILYAHDSIDHVNYIDYHSLRMGAKHACVLGRKACSLEIECR